MRKKGICLCIWGKGFCAVRILYIPGYGDGRQGTDRPGAGSKRFRNIVNSYKKDRYGSVHDVSLTDVKASYIFSQAIISEASLASLERVFRLRQPVGGNMLEASKAVLSKGTLDNDCTRSSSYYMCTEV